MSISGHTYYDLGPIISYPTEIRSETTTGSVEDSHGLSGDQREHGNVNETDAEQDKCHKYREVAMEVSYYTNNDEGMDGHGITTMGTITTQGRTVAMSTQYALGTRIIIDGHEYVNEDTGSYIVGNRVDIYVEDKETAYRLGRTTKIVKVESD